MRRQHDAEEEMQGKASLWKQQRLAPKILHLLVKTLDLKFDC